MLKSFRLFTWLLFILYLAVLIYVIVLKSGHAFIYARNNAEISFIQKLITVNLILFKTIFNYLGGNESYAIAIQNILGNIFAFGPLGFLVPILFKKCKKVKNIFFISVSVSLSIEIVQLLFNIGSCDIDDIILNVLGAILGFGVYKVLNKMVKKDLGVTS